MKTVDTWKTLAVRVSTGKQQYESLKERGADVLLARVMLDNGETAIFKFWNRPTTAGFFRRLTHTGTAWKERAALQLLHTHHLKVPEVYALLTITDTEAKHTECLIVEDLGRCADSTEFFKAAIRSNDTAAIEAFERNIISSTKTMIDCRLLDIDHRLPNYVITPEGEPVRLDFELARRIHIRQIHTKEYGLMIGTLLGSYIFAVQPNTARMEHFFNKLIDVPAPPASVLHIAAARIHDMLERQRQEIGMDITFNPPWEKSS